ncbi:inorganic carbon transporter [Calothrix sp. NIES-4101]|nr:inorganic carbon transporter [Calothrix sp. NIES-4101]
MTLKAKNHRLIILILVFLLGLVFIAATLLIFILDINIEQSLIITIASIIVAIFLFFIVFKQFQIGFAILMFMLPFEELLGIDGGGSFTRYLIIVNLIGMLSQKVFVRPNKIKFYSNRILQVFLILIIWTFTTSFWSTYPERSFVITTTSIGNLILLYSVFISNIKWLSIYWISMILGSFVAVNLTLLLPGSQGLENDVTRFTTGGQDPNDLAGLLLIAMGTGMYGIYPKIQSKIGKILLILILCCLLVAVVFTQSRTGLIALLMLLLIRFSDSKQKNVYGYYVLFGIVVSLIYVFAGDTISNIVSNYASQIFARFNELDENTLAQARVNVWEATIEAIKQNFFLGVGAGNMPYVIDNYSNEILPRSSYDPNQGLVAHNIILGIWGETGLIGLIIFLLMFFITFKQAFVLAKDHYLGKSMLIALFVVCIMGMSLSWENKKIVYIILGTISALWRYRNNSLGHSTNVKIN